jgi:hypothetical protein
VFLSISRYKYESNSGFQPLTLRFLLSNSARFVPQPRIQSGAEGSLLYGESGGFSANVTGFGATVPSGHGNLNWAETGLTALAAGLDASLGGSAEPGPRAPSGLPSEPLIPPAADAQDRRLCDLPGDITLRPGEPPIEFFGAEGLAAKLFGLSQATANNRFAFARTAKEENRPAGATPLE